MPSVVVNHLKAAPYLISDVIESSVFGELEMSCNGFVARQT